MAGRAVTALLIGHEEDVKIAELVAFATANPLDPARVIALADENLDGVRDLMDMYSIELPVGYHLTYSRENQPCGLCHHLSVSVERENQMPHPEAVEMILQAFGMEPVMQSISIWLEPVDDTTQAINLLQLVEPT